MFLAEQSRAASRNMESSVKKLRNPSLARFLRVSNIFTPKEFYTGCANYLPSRSTPHSVIVLQDLKADNILVEPTGVCKISDFGISKKADIHRGRAFTGLKGTVFWMAPEILSPQEKGYDVKVDIWSVGCIVLEMWTGDRPWKGEELIPVMMKVPSNHIRCLASVTILVAL